ncbi:MAG: DUF362 domain-containing protein [Candidatus Omnitrophota bacterium]
MKSKVYFVAVGNLDSLPVVKKKLTRLLARSRILDFINPFFARWGLFGGLKHTCVVKMHFGEEGNTGFVRPEYVRTVIDSLIKRKVRPFLCDTNTLYKGRRTNSGDHLLLAYEHGFDIDSVGVGVIIPDEKIPGSVQDVDIAGKFIKKAKVAKVFLEADILIGVAHFKGHLMTGFGGALKNIGMGCASREGKLAQHSDFAPHVISDKCVGCAGCVEVCPVSAITIKENKSHIDNDICIGCATCIAACPYYAIEVEWDAGGQTLQEKMVEYAKAVLQKKRKSSAFINFAINITKECDCFAKNDPRICPDIGILASRDPVSLDKASLDLVNKACGKDIFRELHPRRDGLKQLEYAAALGLGNLDYQLIEIDMRG